MAARLLRARAAITMPAQPYPRSVMLGSILPYGPTINIAPPRPDNAPDTNMIDMVVRFALMPAQLAAPPKPQNPFSLKFSKKIVNNQIIYLKMSKHGIDGVVNQSQDKILISPNDQFNNSPRISDQKSPRISDQKVQEPINGRQSKRESRYSYAGDDNYPFNAINSHKQMQRHIDLQKAKPLIPPSEKTSIYMKDERGILMKVNHQRQVVRPGGPNGLQFIGDLPGLEVMNKVYDHKMENIKDPLAFDSDDEKAANVGGLLLPKERPRRNPCNYLKEIDLYGITPTMVVGGQNQFKSWWGVFFSLLVFGSIAFYIKEKVGFFIANQNTYFIQRTVLMDYSTEEGSKVRDLLESQVVLELEINYNKTKIQSQNLNQTQVIKFVTDFLQYLIFEVHQVEIDAVKQTELVHNVEIIDPNQIMMIDTIGPTGTPRFQIDPTMIKIRGDPFMEQRALNGRYNERTYDPNLIYDDPENINNFLQETQDIVPNQTLRQLQSSEPESTSSDSSSTSSSESNSDASDSNSTASDSNSTSETASSSPPGNSLSNPVTTYITIRTNQTKIEQLAKETYLYQAEAYLNSLSQVTVDGYNEYLRRKQIQGQYTKFQELWYFQNLYQKQFIQNCSDFMITVIMTDRYLAQNKDNMGVYVNRTQRLYQRSLGVQNLTQEQSLIRLQMHKIDFDKQFNWPSTSWIFQDKKDLMDSANNTFLQVDKQLSASDWLSDRIEFPLNQYQTVYYGDQLFKVQFYMNPITTMYQKQVIKHWILDQLSDLGGFILFAFLLFYIPCLIIQQKLYEAHITQERYRVKFNKILQGIKDKKFKKKESLKSEQPIEVSKEENQQLSDEELDSDEQRALDEEEQMNEDLKNKEKFDQIYIAEGGNFDDQIYDEYDINDDEIGAISERHKVHPGQVSKQTIRNSEDYEQKESLKKRKNKKDKQNNKSILTSSSKRTKFEGGSDKTPGQTPAGPTDGGQLEPQQTQRALIEDQEQVPGENKDKQDINEVASQKSKKSKQSKSSKKEKQEKAEDDKISKKSGKSSKSKTSKKSKKDKEIAGDQTKDEEVKETPIALETPQPEEKKPVNFKSFLGGLFNKKPEEPKNEEPTNDSPGQNLEEQKKKDDEKDQDQEQEKKPTNLKSFFGGLFNKKQEQTPPEENKQEEEEKNEEEKDNLTKVKEEEQSIKQKFGSFFSKFVKKDPIPVVAEEQKEEEKDKNEDSQPKDDENKLIGDDQKLNQQEEEKKDDQKQSVFAGFGQFFNKFKGLQQKKNDEQNDIEKGNPVEQVDEKSQGKDGQSSQGKLAAIIQPEQVLSQKSSKKVSAFKESLGKQSSGLKASVEKGEKIYDSVVSEALPDKLPNNDNVDADYQPQDKPYYKPYENLQISSFQIIRLFFTPSIFYTYYQLALQRLMNKATSKAKRELEITTLMRRVRDSDNLCKSYETFEVFKGLKKKYKYDYSNVINVSLDTVNSIIEENQFPYLPADAPYMRKKLKTYRMGDNGVIHGVMEFEPYELDKETIKIIARTVWKKLRDDAEMNYQTKKNIEDQIENEKIQYEIGLEFDEYQPAVGKSKSRHKHKKGIQSELGFPINAVKQKEVKPNQKILSEKVISGDEQEELPKARGTIFDQKSRPSFQPPVLDSTIFSKIDGPLTQSKIEEKAKKALNKQVLKNLKNKKSDGSDGDKTPRKII